MAASAGQLALDYSLVSKSSGQTWAFNKAGATDWQDAKPLPGWSRQMFYRLYRQAAENRPCVAFSGYWDVAQDDSEKRPRQAAFGYYCAGPGETLDEGRVVAVLAGMRISGFLRRAAPQDQIDSDTALSFARGADTRAGNGNPGFPRRLARSYTVNDGRRR